MIITPAIKDMVARIDALDANDASQRDALLTQFVQMVAASCATPENKALYAKPASSVLEPYPMDADGYALAFDPLRDEAGFRNTWQRYGMVVGRDIIAGDVCHKTITGVRRAFTALTQNRADLADASTWHAMPRDTQGTPILTRGFFEIYHDDMLAQLRQNMRAYLHHVLIWGRADLWTSFDRLGIKLPHHEESAALPLHVDQNPNVHPDFKTVQGVLALTDCPTERGTFLGVPGSRAHFAAYGAMAKNNGEHVELDVNAPIAKTLLAHAQPIPLRAGHFVSWDSRTSHANTENISNDMRMVFYMAAGPAREDNTDAVAARLDALQTGIGSNVREALMHASKKPRYTNPDALARIRTPEQLTILGKLLYGTERYSTITAPAVA